MHNQKTPCLKPNRALYIYLATASAAVVIIFAAAATENKNYKDDNPKASVITEATVVTKAHKLHLLLCILGKFILLIATAIVKTSAASATASRISAAAE